MASRLQALLQEQADLRGELRGISDVIDREARARTDNERERSQAIVTRLTALEGEVGEEQAIRAAQAHQPAVADLGERFEREAMQRPVDLGASFAHPTPFTTKGMDFRRAFGAQLQAVARSTVAAKNGGEVDPRLIEIQRDPMAVASGASEGAASDGGFLVQVDTASELFKEVHQQAILYPQTKQTTLGAMFDSLRINAIDETSRANGSRWGGVQAYWTGEAGALTATKPKFRQVELRLQKLTGLYYATDELLKDADALGQVASEAFTEEFGFKIDDAIMRGVGAGMPLGVIGHAGTVSITKETNQPAATILKENIDKMFARMMPQSLNRAQWYINQDCWPQLFSLAQAVGVGGVPMFVPAGGMGNNPGGLLYGRPIIPIEQADTCGTVGDITFADFSQYRTIDKGGIEAASSIHVLFLTDEMTFRFILRMDGQPIRNSAITPYKGTATQSPFITLATRS